MREIGLDRNELEGLAEEIIGQGGYFSFKAHGWSMFPFIHDGDILTVGSVNPNELKPGDIILYKSFDNRIVVHRVIGKTKIDNYEMLKVRGDALMGQLEYVFPKKVLGRVTKQLRDSKIIDLQKGTTKFLARIWLLTYPIGSLCMHFIFIVKKFLAFIFRFLQGFRLYRKIAKMLIGNKSKYLVFADDLTLSDNKLKEFFSLSDMTSISNRSFSYEICAYIGKKKVGSVTLLKFDENNMLYPDWWLFGMTVKTVYRGAGIGKNLLLLANNKAFEVGADRLNLLVFEKNRIARNLYEQIGFRKTSIPALDKQLEEEVQKGHPRRIIMSNPYYS